jgi:hypothetical protein
LGICLANLFEILRKLKMCKSIWKLLALTVGLSCLSFNALAHLATPNVTPNSINGDNVVVTASFPSPVTGDLYFAVDVGGGNLMFFTPDLTPNVGAFSSNQAFSQDMTLLNLPASVVPAGTYTLYEVVAKAGSNVLDPNNWIDGFSGLSQLTINVNLNNTAPVVVKTPAVDTVATGKALYKSLTCSTSTCHGSNPLANKNRVLLATSLSALKLAIRKNPSDMSYLSSTSDADLQAVADYINSLR